MVSFCLPPLPDEPPVRVVVRWRDGRASRDEVAALRRLLPELRDRPIADVFREARAAPEWVLATCHPARARRHQELAERVGLVTAVEPATAEFRPVSDDEVVAGLTMFGQAVADFFVVGGALCYSTGPGEVMARVITDAALAAATRAYLRRVGVRQYASYQEVVADRGGEQAPAG